MPSVEIVSMDRQKVGEVDLSPVLFEARVNRALLHEVVTLARTNGRTGTRAVKGRSDVSGGGRKPWRQKGTGRARAGSIRSPLWRGGGTVFGPQPKDYNVRIPRKKRRAALRAALTWKLQVSRLTIIDKIEAPEGKTRELAGLLAGGGWDSGGVLMVDVAGNDLVSRAARNLASVKFTRPEGLTVMDIFLYRHLLITRAALEKMQEEWGK